MRKKVKQLFVLVLAIIVITSSNVILANSPIGLIIEGKYVQLDQAPLMDQGRVLVPLRGIFEHLGAEMAWDASTGSVIGKKDNTIIQLKIGSDLAYVNNQAIKLDVPGKIIDGRTMVPIRFIGESLGVMVNWDMQHKRVIIGNESAPLEDTREAATELLDEKEVYKKIIALKEKYPEKMPWTDENFYAWKGGIFGGGSGCAGFAFLLSDEAFGDLKARNHSDFTKLRVGDMVRINNDTHFVIILSIEGQEIIDDDYLEIIENENLTQYLQAPLLAPF